MMKKFALLAALIATVSLGACASYHQGYKGGSSSMDTSSKSEAADRAAMHGDAGKYGKQK